MKLEKVTVPYINHQNNNVEALQFLLHEIYYIFVFKTVKLIQITKEVVIDFIRKNEIELKSTHAKLCLPIINRLYKKMSTGIKFSSIKVADGLIIDGHHRYLASLLANFELETVISSRTSAIALSDWILIDYVEEDWDTQAKIKMLNEEDAKYNEVSVEKIVELLK